MAAARTRETRVQVYGIHIRRRLIAAIDPSGPDLLLSWRMTRRRLPPLNPLRNFEAAARTGSFAAAADELNVTSVAVSRQVAVLEAYFDKALFIRRANTIELSAHGAALLPSVTAALDQLADGAQRLRHAGDRSIVLCTYQAFAMCWLIPRLKQFTAAYPHINLSLTTAATPAEFEAAQADICIKYGHNAHSDIPGIAILPDIVMPVCSPAVAQGRFPLPPLTNLSRHTLLRSRYRRLDWPDWLAAAGGSAIETHHALSFNESGLANQAAAQGVGVAIAQRLLVDAELADGRLIRPFDMALRRVDDIWMTWRTDHAENQNVERVRAWLVDEADKTRLGFGIEFSPADFDTAQALRLPPVRR